MAGSSEFEWDWSSEAGYAPPDPEASRADDAAARQRAERLVPGATFGGFLLLDLLGRGGMGVVFRAREQASGREVALKVLGRGRLGPRQQERFRREGELTAALQHPGIVRVHASGEEDGLPWLAYELIPGGRSLEDLLRAGTRDQALGLLREAAEAVGHAHARGVVHRDLKPSNVLIDATGHARVADFGLALGESHERMTQTGAIVGTPSYMSPEQVQGKREVGPRSDVWSLGVILYQALTGRLPFECSSFLELAARVVDANPAAPRDLVPEVAPALEAVCLRALAGDPELRHPDAGAFAAELGRALAGEEVDPAPHPRRRPGAGRQRLLAVGLLAALLAAGGLAARQARADREAAARGLLQAARRDPARRDELAALLEGGAGLSDALRAEGHLLLAEVAGGPEERLRQARAAGALNAGHKASRLEGEALLALGRPAEAIAPLGRAAAAGEASHGLLIALGRALLAAGRHAEALETARSLQARFPSRPEGEELELRVRVASDGLDPVLRALEERQRQAPDPERALLRARLLREAGRDALPGLRLASERWSDAPALRRGLALALLEAHELEELAARLSEWARRAPLELDLRQLQALSAALLADPLPRPRLEVPGEQRGAVVTWLLTQARRELGLGQRVRFPVMRERWAGTACDPAGHLARARARLEQALGLGPEGAPAGQARLLLGQLEPPGSPAQQAAAQAAARLLPGDPRAGLLLVEASLPGDPARALELLGSLAPVASDARAQRMRGEALLRLGRPGEALLPLQAAWGEERLAPEPGRLLAEALEAAGQASAAAEARERVARLLGSRRQEAWQVFLTGRVQLKLSPHERAAAYARALELDPLCEEARFGQVKGQGGSFEDPEGPLRAILSSLERLPYLWLLEMLEELRGISAMAEAGRSGLRSGLLRLQAAARPEDALLRGFLGATLVEFERGSAADLEAAVRDLDQALDADPSSALAWAWRGFLHVRAGRWPQAERDLGVARECHPEVAALYLCLLAAARRASPDEVMVLLEDAFRRGYPPTNVEALPNYPELAPYLKDTRFRERAASFGAR